MANVEGSGSQPVGHGGTVGQVDHDPFGRITGGGLLPAQSFGLGQRGHGLAITAQMTRDRRGRPTLTT
ncbi:hypothetical protein [Streptomyces sp. NPDC002133]|uniref:hypothetical protein n=1 Tax=Streptomyces sp. NPDC002133 TaxID=3154409 RepID=UPI00333112F9